VSAGLGLFGYLAFFKPFGLLAGSSGIVRGALLHYGEPDNSGTSSRIEGTALTLSLTQNADGSVSLPVATSWPAWTSGTTSVTHVGLYSTTACTAGTMVMSIKIPASFIAYNGVVVILNSLSLMAAGTSSDLGPSTFAITKLMANFASPGSTSMGAVAAQLHVGHPGPNGTSNVSSTTARRTGSGFNATGVAYPDGYTPVIMIDQDAWVWASSTEAITHVTLWDSVTAGAGNFLWSFQGNKPFIINSGETFAIKAMRMRAGVCVL